MNDFEYILENRKRKHCFVPQVRRIWFRQNFEFTNIAYRSPSLVFALRLASSSKMKDCYGGKEFDMSYPNFILKWPNITYTAIGHGYIDSVLITYPAEAAEFFMKAGFDPNRSCYQLQNVISITDILQKISATIESIDSAESVSRIDMYCFAIIHELLLLSEENEKKDFKSEQAISTAAAYLHIHYLDEINIDDLARRFGFSRRSFSRHWKVISNLAPAEYLKKLRLDYAMEKLVCTDCTMEDIAWELHYSSAAYFCSMFKDAIGISPYQYRLKMQQHPLKIPNSG